MHPEIQRLQDAWGFLRLLSNTFYKIVEIVVENKGKYSSQSFLDLCVILCNDKVETKMLKIDFFPKYFEFI